MAFETNIPFKEEHPNKYSSLWNFYKTLGSRGVIIKSNYECHFETFVDNEIKEMLTFYGQSINIPGLKTTNTELFYKGRSVQIPTFIEQEHDFQLTIINDASGQIYSTMRELMMLQYHRTYHKYSNINQKITINVLSDMTNFGGMKIELNNITFNNVSGMDFSHSDSSLQTFTVSGYSMFTRVWHTIKK